MGGEGETKRTLESERAGKEGTFPKAAGGRGGVNRQGQMLGAQTEKEASRFGNEVVTGDLQWSQSGRPDCQATRKTGRWWFKPSTG